MPSLLKNLDFRGRWFDFIVLLFSIEFGISYKTTSVFGKLAVMGLGIPIVSSLYQYGSGIQVLPVTGQNLPMISSGGTSAWMTCIAMGIILSISVQRGADGQVQSKKEPFKRIK